MKRFNISIFILFVLATLVSCITNDVLDTPTIPVAGGSVIVFGADLKDAEEVSSRGGDLGNRVGNRSIVSEDEENSIPLGIYIQTGIQSASGESSSTRGSVKTSVDAFNVWATYKKDANTTINYFEGVLYENDENGVYFPVYSDEEYYWPGAGSLNFVAVSNTPSNGWVAKYENNALKSFEYTTPADPTKQNDIMVATATASGNANSEVGLSFEHVMSAVNVKIGSVVAGEIRSITFKNVYNKGEYLVDQDVWVVDKSSVGDFTVKMEDSKFVSTGSNQSGTAVNTEDAVFMFIPQNPGDDAEMVIEFYDSLTGHLYSDAQGAYKPALRGSIADDNWDKNKTTNYVLSIDESFTMTIEPVGKKMDAHYVIGYANVTVEGIDSWSITATTNDGSVVTIQPEEEVNPLAKEGFWTDKVVNANGVVTNESARGSSSWKGTGNVTDKLFYIFVPENISKADREISLILKDEGSSSASTTKVLLQKYPNWTDGGFGWETVDDDEAGIFGFKWTRKIAYIYPYTKVIASTVKNHCQDFIDDYGAGENGFATVGTISMGILQTRAYILLDYSKLNSVQGADSSTDGYSNTLALYRHAGTTATSQFETILTTTMKTESGHETEPMFRYPTDNEIERGCPAESGKANDLSAVMEYIQKKNRYYLQKKTVSGDSSGSSYVPYFFETDLLWYLPAYEQFGKFVPNPNVANDAAALYWSSTTAGTTTAWTGGAEEKDRDLEYRVIAVRKDENNYGTASVNTPSWIE